MGSVIMNEIRFPFFNSKILTGSIVTLVISLNSSWKWLINTNI